MSRGTGAPLVVLGDALLDIDLTGRATRLVPDEPAPVLEHVVQTARPGGAGLAAVLAASDAPVVLVTALADDAQGRRLRALLDLHVEVVALDRPAGTVVKSRLRAHGRTVARVDEGEPTAAVAPGPRLGAQLGRLLGRAHAVLVCDYGQGLTGVATLRDLLGQAAQRVPVVWDPHPRGHEPVPGVELVTPNADEARLLSGVPGSDLAAVVAQSRYLAMAWQARGVVVTRGAAGAVLAPRTGTPLVVPVPDAVDGDSCGAGDAFAVGAAIALGAGADPTLAVRAGVARSAGFLHDGGVAGLGTAAGSGRRARHAPGPATSAPSPAQAVVERVRAAGGTVVMAGGCFDLLHAGHVAYLQAARGLGDCLVVAVNSDAGVRRLKGPGRPLVPEADRVRVLAALGCVDAVELFDEPTPAGVLDRLRPDVFVKGGDYLGTGIPEAPVVAGYGGQVVVVPTLEGRSSTGLVRAARTTPHHQEDACPTQTPA